jgi:hypothetical protein
VPFECGKIYVGQTGRSIKTDFSCISILDNATGYIDRVIKENIETRLHPTNFNRDCGFMLSRSWYPVTNMLKQYRDTPILKQALNSLASSH